MSTHGPQEPGQPEEHDDAKAVQHLVAMMVFDQRHRDGRAAGEAPPTRTRPGGGSQPDAAARDHRSHAVVRECTDGSEDVSRSAKRA